MAARRLGYMATRKHGSMATWRHGDMEARKRGDTVVRHDVDTARRQHGTTAIRGQGSTARRQYGDKAARGHGSAARRQRLGRAARIHGSLAGSHAGLMDSWTHGLLYSCTPLPLAPSQAGIPAARLDGCLAAAHACIPARCRLQPSAFVVLASNADDQCWRSFRRERGTRRVGMSDRQNDPQHHQFQSPRNLLGRPAAQASRNDLTRKEAKRGQRTPELQHSSMVRV